MGCVAEHWQSSSQEWTVLHCGMLLSHWLASTIGRPISYFCICTEIFGVAIDNVSVYKKKRYRDDENTHEIDFTTQNHIGYISTPENVQVVTTLKCRHTLFSMDFEWWLFVPMLVFSTTEKRHRYFCIYSNSKGYFNLCQTNSQEKEKSPHLKKYMGIFALL